MAAYQVVIGARLVTRQPHGQPAAVLAVQGLEKPLVPLSGGAVLHGVPGWSLSYWAMGT
jgi:hypothetical protein